MSHNNFISKHITNEFGVSYSDKWQLQYVQFRNSGLEIGLALFDALLLNETVQNSILNSNGPRVGKRRTRTSPRVLLNDNNR